MSIKLYQYKLAIFIMAHDTITRILIASLKKICGFTISQALNLFMR